MSDEKEKVVVEQAFPTAKTFKQTLDVMAIAIQIGHVPCLWGLPGIGKTSSVRSYCEWLKHLFEAVLGSIMEPPDIIGYPVPNGDELRRLPEAWVQRARNPNTVVLFDDLTTLYPSMFAATMRVIHEKRVGDVDLSHVKMIAAANPPEFAPNGRPLPAALANRMIHDNVAITGQEWGPMRRAEFKYFANPPKIEKSWVEHKPWAIAAVTSYVERNSSAIHNMPKDIVNQGRAWASPRTWDVVIDHLAACKSAKLDNEMRDICIASCVGGVSAVPFIAYLNEQFLADPEDLLKAGYDAKLPERADSAYVALTSLITAVVSNPTQERYTQALRVLSKVDPAVAYPISSELRKIECKGIEMTEELAKLFSGYSQLA